MEVGKLMNRTDGNRQHPGGELGFQGSEEVGRF